MKNSVINEFNEHIKTANLLFNLTDAVDTSAQLCIDCLKNGGKILIFGNGGSAADAQHIAAELLGRFKTERRALAAIALTTDTSTLTSIGNDYGFERVFSRQIEALATPGDVIIGISTGGRSPNVIRGLRTSSKMNCKTIGLSGRSGGDFNEVCDINLIVPSEDTPRIQEMHILIGHTICHLIEQAFTN
jgi:D-sedoheptulose 7-phosphate isomerase